MRVLGGVLLSVLVFVGLVGAAGSENYNGVRDTSFIAEFQDDSVAYSKAFDLSRYEDVCLVTIVSDTTEAGFADDSTEIEIAYQLGYPVLNSSGAIDTAWSPDFVVIDTLTSAKYGVATSGTIDSTGAMFVSRGAVDTSNVSGYAVMSSWFVPQWAPLIRYRYSGLADNNPDGFLILIAQDSRRIHINTTK
jgi:hypothetical protein